MILPHNHTAPNGRTTLTTQGRASADQVRKSSSSLRISKPPPGPTRKALPKTLAKIQKGGERTPQKLEAESHPLSLYIQQGKALLGGRLDIQLLALYQGGEMATEPKFKKDRFAISMKSFLILPDKHVTSIKKTYSSFPREERAIPLFFRLGPTNRPQTDQQTRTQHLITTSQLVAHMAHAKPTISESPQVEL